MIVDEIAEYLYTSDNSVIPWDKALVEDHVLYIRLAEVLIESIAQYLDSESVNYDGSLHLAAQLLNTQIEVSRLRRQRKVPA